MNDVVFRSYAAVLCLERDAEASRRGATHFESGVLAVESDESGLIVGLMGVDSLTDERGGEVRSGGIERSGNAEALHESSSGASNRRAMGRSLRH